MTIEAKVSGGQKITATVNGDKIAATIGQAGAVSATVSGVGPQGAAGTTQWVGIQGKPAEFPPEQHAHVAADVTDFTEAVVAAAPPTTDASLLTTGTLDGARLPSHGGFDTVQIKSAGQAQLNDVLFFYDGTGSIGSLPIGGIPGFTDAVVAAAPPTVDASLLTQGTLDAARLPASGVSSGTYTSVTVDETGRVTAGGPHDVSVADVDGLQAALDGKQAAGTYATLVGGKVPSDQLPSYVDDVIEAASLAALPATGEAGKIYVTIDTNKTYRWSGSTYIEVSAGASAWGDISGKPDFATVATSGSYNDLLNKPTIPSAYALPTASTTVLGGVKVDGSSVTITDGVISVSTNYATATHSHEIGDVNGLTQALVFKQPLLADGYDGQVLTMVNGIWDPADLPAPAWSTITSTPTTLAGYGITDAVASNDARLTDARTPTAHSHGNINNLGQVSAAFAPAAVGGPVVFGGLTGAIGRGEFGTSAGTVCQGNDARLSNARTPTAHTHTASAITDFAIAVAAAAPPTTDASLLTSGTLDAARLPLATTTAAGGVIVGSGLSVSGGTVSVVTYTRRSDTVGSVSYIGRAASGTATSDEAWTIKKTTIASSGSVSSTVTAANVKWDDRLTATYS